MYSRHVNWHSFWDPGGLVECRRAICFPMCPHTHIITHHNATAGMEGMLSCVLLKLSPLPSLQAPINFSLGWWERNSRAQPSSITGTRLPIIHLLPMLWSSADGRDETRYVCPVPLLRPYSYVCMNRVHPLILRPPLPGPFRNLACL